MYVYNRSMIGGLIMEVEGVLHQFDMFLSFVNSAVPDLFNVTPPPLSALLMVRHDAANSKEIFSV